MGKNILYVSFDHADPRQLEAFRALQATFANPVDFAVHPSTGPTDPRSKPVLDEIVGKFDRARKLVVLMVDTTHNDAWVEWEVRTFYDMKEKIYGNKTWSRICGMRLQRFDNAQTPEYFVGRTTETIAWNPDRLDAWVAREA